MNRLEELLKVSKDAVFELCLRVPIDELEGFFEAYVEFRFLLASRTFMDQLAEINDVPYSMSLDGLIKYSKMSINDRLIEASKNGDVRSVERMLASGTEGVAKRATGYNRVMFWAALGGYIEIVQMMLDRGADNYNGTMSNAAKGGHIEIVKLMLDSGATGYDGAMYNAAQNGHIKIVQMMLDRGADEYDWVMSAAAYGGHIKIVQMMLDLGANDYDGAIPEAADCGHMDIVKYLEEIKGL